MQPITVVVARRPISGKEKEMEAFADDVKNVVSQSPGHLETVICKPDNANDPEYRIVIKFDNLKNYLYWERSQEREQLSKKGNAIADEPPQLKVLSGLETMFSPPGNNLIKAPAKYKMVVVIWLCLFPLASLFNWLLNPHIYSWPQIGKTFIMTLIIVPIMTYIAMPMMRKAFAKWLYPDTEER